METRARVGAGALTRPAGQSPAIFPRVDTHPGRLVWQFQRSEADARLEFSGVPSIPPRTEISPHSRWCCSGPRARSARGPPPPRCSSRAPKRVTENAGHPHFRSAFQVEFLAPSVFQSDCRHRPRVEGLRKVFRTRKRGSPKRKNLRNCQRPKRRMRFYVSRDHVAREGVAGIVDAA